MPALRSWLAALGLPESRPAVMGVLNVTPDSFSDGGRFLKTQDAVAAGLAMLDAGVDIIDIGGESTRPGANQSLAPDAEQARIIPVITALAKAGARISVDTRHAGTMRAVLDAGAAIINDVSALRYDCQSRAIIARRRCPVILMHMRGTPATMQSLTDYDDVVADVRNELTRCVADAEAAGIARENIAIDPGIGFAKTAGQNIEILRRLPELAELDLPIVIGASRKTFIGRLGNVADPKARMPGSLAVALFAALKGASILRVHDVPETIQAITIWQYLT